MVKLKNKIHNNRNHILLCDMTRLSLQQLNNKNIFQNFYITDSAQNFSISFTIKTTTLVFYTFLRWVYAVFYHFKKHFS